MKKIMFTFAVMTSSAFAQEPLDQYYSPEEMAASRAMLKHITGAMNQTFVMADKFEYRPANGGALAWEAKGWHGGDKEKLWINSEAEYSFEEDGFEEGNVEILYSRAVSPFFDVQAGIKQDFNMGPGRTYGQIGFMGLAPYWFELGGALNISNKGEVSANFEVEYELLLTQRLILQPAAEISINFEDIEEMGIGSGLSDLEAGLRLRYEIFREIAPYIGVSWHKKFGQTAEFAEHHGHSSSEASFVAGVRMWY
ncbi:copper resistance protein B [Pseudemcibacter aquimaris]|uniref:copper resistance protein B n=1 Tax=Pseudemcibacter aquimaris TaxID=2857064 RepID=UPI0020130CDF|nr:copper resistance protein B [Pseudemcibacter aquimaris]MCC3859838.1 copper resistance protein B [Pseudemcibacter aquimaris]WDU57170.1 copper resistance protein B [Pseudemcibacter aquimaris]